MQLFLVALRIWPGIKSLLLSFYLVACSRTADLVGCYVFSGSGSEFVLSIGSGLRRGVVFLVAGGRSGNLGE